ncbi:S8 family peptidase [Acinetobacter dispersus]|uniref:S8 family peptidase n=1 Tax=Acinetobacter dispersus TaxID=70348 RepID=UPI0021CDE707|nr:S8 family peptidase [Acinetobacter dispersus]MCU4336035.1 S8 family peptidase [Acinetobacter dispersus]
MDKKQHINFNSENHNFSYTSKNRVPNPPIPFRNYYQHANNLLIEFSNAEKEFNKQKDELLQDIDSFEKNGIYLTITSSPNFTLPLESLETRDIHLANVQFNDSTKTEEATIFISENKRSTFLKKISEYINTISKDPTVNPKNKPLVNSIDHIKLASLKDFWTDALELFPKDEKKTIWWEVWIKKIGDNPEYTYDLVKTFAKSINAELGNNYLSFFNNMVFLIKASAEQLEKSLFIMINLLELRYVAETPSFFVNLNSIEQQNWIDDLIPRISTNKKPTTSICILDTGVNYNHPLLKIFCSDNLSISYNPSWPKYDVKPRPYERSPYSPHGSMQAGIAGFGSLQAHLESNDCIEIGHVVESGRILPPQGFNNPDLYGAITTETSYKIEINNTEIKNRIYSLAVSANPNNTGTPSSWSSEIDRFSFGDYSEFLKRLFIISTGNNIDLDPNIDLWDQAHLAKIEDPAQSWNSLTVGSMTNLSTLTDPNYTNWKPWSEKGDISPSTKTSVNWEWRKQAPLKPDFVLEGGNRIISPETPRDVTNHDDVSILTTSGDINFPFDSHLDSSAASALASNYAALISDKYPNYWPETIRGLLIHSCKYNKSINEAYKKLRNDDNLPKNVALETILRTVGYGVPNIDKALNSYENHAHVVLQNTLKPFKKGKFSNIALNEWHLIQLPWPIEELSNFSSSNVELKITLSYFIEPNPQNKGYKSKFSYQSHGLRFKFISPNQTLENFKASINKEDLYDEYEKSDAESKGWFLGANLRTKGCIHSDIWQGTAAELITMNTIAIYPISGWWKSAKAKERWKNKIRYSLIISIDCKENIDIYSSITSKIENLNRLKTEAEIIIKT